jgi:hypothetical protein
LWYSGELRREGEREERGREGERERGEGERMKEGGGIRNKEEVTCSKIQYIIIKLY